jgi:hypothetical protein
MPIVWKPFLAGFAVSFALCLVGIFASMFSAQKLHGEARWARFGEVKGANLLDDAGIILGRLAKNFCASAGQSMSCSKPLPVPVRALASSSRTCCRGQILLSCSM